MKNTRLLVQEDEMRGKALIRELAIATRWIDAFEPPRDLELVLSTLRRGQKVAASLIELAESCYKKAIERLGTPVVDIRSEYDRYLDFSKSAMAAVDTFHKSAFMWTDSVKK